MKFTSLITQTLFSSICLLASFSGTQSALAQTTRLLKVTVPFAFESGSHRFAAGDYRIEIQPNNLIGIRSADGKDFSFVMVNNEIRNAADTTGKLVFQRYGGRLFLKQVWMPHDPVGLRCPRSRAEREAELAANSAPYTTVMLALLSHP